MLKKVRLAKDIAYYGYDDDVMGNDPYSNIYNELILSLAGQQDTIPNEHVDKIRLSIIDHIICMTKKIL